jgi:eukaryotic-like serine/threonine-protein kinase
MSTDPLSVTPEQLTAWLSTLGASERDTLEQLIARMRERSDFPALSDSVIRIQRVADADSASVGALTAEILKDPALTQKLLRIVNSAYFTRGERGNVSTVSRAVTLLGFNSVRNIATSLVLLDHLRDKNQAASLMDELLRSLLAGTLAGELATNARDREEVFIGSMFQHLGRLVAGFYFPTESQRIKEERKHDPSPEAEERIAHRVLGVSHEQLGQAVALMWGLPEHLRRGMVRPDGPTPSRPVPAGLEQQRWISRLANDLSELLMVHEWPQAQPRLAEIARREAHAIGLKVSEVEQAVHRACTQFNLLADALNVRFAPSSPVARLLSAAARVAQQPQDTWTLLGGGGHTHAVADFSESTQAQLEAPRDPRQPNLNPLQSQAVLVAGVQDVTQAQLEGRRLTEQVQIILETLYRALELRCVVLALRDATGEYLVGKLGLGVHHKLVVQALRVPLKQPNDLFAAVCKRGADTLITDATEPRMAARMPGWFPSLQVGSFILLPLARDEQTLGLIYGDHERPGALNVNEAQLSLIRTLRNQAAMVLRERL